MDYFKALEVFVAVADKGSFAGASRHLGTSPPSITRIVSDLEQDLGVTLFHRTTRLVSLTDAGHNYLDDARRIIGELETANDAVQGAHVSPKGHLRVTASTLFGQHYILPIITDFLNSYDEVTVEALFLNRVVNLLGEGIDVAVRIGHLQDSSLMARKVGTVQSVIFTSPEYIAKFGEPKSPEELHQHNLIATRFTDSKARWTFHNGQKLQVEPRLTFTSIAASIEAAKSGWGIGRGLSYQVAKDLESGSLVQVLKNFMPDPLPVHIMHGEGQRASGKVRAFVDFAVERLKDNPYLSAAP